MRPYPDALADVLDAEPSAHEPYPPRVSGARRGAWRTALLAAAFLAGWAALELLTRAIEWWWWR